MNLKTNLSFLLLFCVVFMAQAQRSDVIIFNAGNRIVGEVKKLEYGSLFCETDDAGDLHVDWINIVKLRSDNVFDITLEDGRRFKGSLDTTENDGEVVVVSNGERTVVPVMEVVVITQLNRSFFSRIDGFLKLGFSYTKASEVLQINSSAEVTYRSFTDEVALGGNVVFTRQQVSDTSITNKKQDAYIIYRRFFKKRWFVFGVSGIAQNTELGVKYRATAGGGAGKDLFRTNVHLMQIGIGSIYSHEESIDNIGTDNAEGLAQVYYKVYKNTMPEVSLTAGSYAYPSFTDPGRVRVNAELSFDAEVISDFTIGISNYHNYDNRPISATASNYDWGIIFNLGYSF